MVDYIIVGLGLSGLAVTRQLQKEHKSFVVFEDHSQGSSLVAGGLYNPVILKRFTLAWQVERQLPIALDFYNEFEREFNISIHKKMPVYRKFNSVEEQNNWFSASDKPKLQKYLDTKLEKEINSQVPAVFSFGKINHTGIIDTDSLLGVYRKFLLEKQLLRKERFQYDQLTVLPHQVEYQGVKAKGIIFCEGFGIKANPFFGYLPLIGNKGEYIIIKSEQLNLDVIVKTSIFIIPMGNNLYRVGASYKHGDKSPHPTEATREELEVALRGMISCDYEVVGQEAGIRPSTVDRRPILGAHPKYKNLFICNGFGSRGVLIAPTAGKELSDFILKQTALNREVDVKRFTKKYFN